MCDQCRTEHGLVALEAIANGEEIPETPENADAEVIRRNVHLPFPVVAQVGDEDFVAIVTNAEGWKAISGFLEALGRPCDPDCDHG